MKDNKQKRRITFEQSRALDTYKTASGHVSSDAMNRITFKPVQSVSNLEQVIAKVSNYLRVEKGRDEDTVRMYIGYIKSAWNLYNVHDPTYQNALELINTLYNVERPPTKNHPEKRRGLAPSTINHYIEALTYWANAIGLITDGLA